MDEDQEPGSVQELLDRIAGIAEEEERVSLAAIMQAVGRRSFAPVLLVAGLITLAPVVGDIPGVPTTMGVLTLLTAGQLLLRRNHLWLPSWLIKRSVAREKVCKGIGWMRPWRGSSIAGRGRA